MILYTWAVVKDCRLVGYVKSYSERDAMKLAEMKYGTRLFVERVNLNEPVKDTKDNYYA